MAQKKPESIITPDVQVGGGGTIYTVRPLTDAGRAWIEANVQSEDWQWLGSALCVEHRYIANLIEGMKADGLIVE